MKNEIGRKLTSLTIMAIMFAGGMAIGVPSFMPEALSQTAETAGLLTVSSTTIQGAAVLEIVVNDPDVSNIDDDVTAISVDFGSNTYDMTQASNGKWYVYIVDASTSSTMDAVAGGMEFGILCTAGLSVSGSKITGAADSTPFIVSSADNVWAAAIKTSQAVAIRTSFTEHLTPADAGNCQDIDGATGVTDATAGTTSREDLTAVILANAPSVSDPDNDAANLGQRGHGLNASGYGSWPYIVSIDFTNNNIVAYGGDSINVEYGNTDSETSISLANQNPGANSELHLSITDPALNIDPTTADIWLFDISDNDGDYTTVELATNGTTNTAFTAANLGTMGFVSNGALSSDNETVLASGNNTATPTASDSCCTVDTVIMTESGANTGVFESWDANGNSQLLVTRDAAADTNTVFSYGGNSVDMIITYNDASITMDAGGDTWQPATAITISVNDPEANINPTSAETLKIADETVVIPTIVMGTPKTLATGSNFCLAQTYNAHIGPTAVGVATGSTPIEIGTACFGIDTDPSTGDVGGGAAADTTSAGNTINVTGVNVGSPGGGVIFGVNVDNTTDHSQRLRITHNGTTNASADDQPVSATTTWINVTTGHTKADLVGLAGTVVLSYDVSGPADLLTSTDINVYLWDTGNNDSGNTATAAVLANSLMSVQIVGNVKAGVVDLDDDVTFIKDPSMTMGGTEGKAKSTWSTGAGTNLVTIGFEFTHAAGNNMSNTDDYAIAADF
ncbi:hypothetical protein HX849_01585, partial [Marine Group I thaumarchaeote]|nr:hypothetical protein [Marine Group I thaumarchaeote]